VFGLRGGLGVGEVTRKGARGERGKKGGGGKGGGRGNKRMKGMKGTKERKKGGENMNDKEKRGKVREHEEKGV